MKKLLILFTGLALCMPMFAAFRTAEEAMRIAASLETGTHVAHLPARQPSQLTHCFTAKQASGQPAFYVFNRGEEEGFVLISAEDRTHTVLGYSDTGHWDEAKMPEATRAWIEMYCKTISHAASSQAYMSSFAPRRQAKEEQPYTPIDPLCLTQWGQDVPYNLLCPMYNGERCVTGCVATAAAQIMKVHSYPTKGTGSYSYLWQSDTGDSIKLTVNPGNTTYHWEEMLNEYPASATTAQKNAVATLMYHCGVVSEMQYTPGSSGTNNNIMLAGMINHFGYDPGVQVLIKDCMKEKDFVAGIDSELQQGRPVMFSARTIENEGHAFVCDGIDADGLIHINWGWYGFCDGYFRVSAMDPEDQGIGGSLSNEAYTEDVVAYTHIRPFANGSYYYTIMSGSVYPMETAVDRSQGWVALQEDEFQNYSIITLTGTSAALKVYDANGNFLTYCDDEWSYDGLEPGYYYYTQYAVGDVSMLPEGSYFISPAMKYQNNYFPVQVKGYSDYRCPMLITKDSIYLGEALPDIDVNKALNAYDYTAIDAFLYPTESLTAHYWGVQLSTKDFYEDDAVNQMLLSFSITGASPRSFIGSFLHDTTSVYRMQGATAYRGNINTYQEIPIEDAELTVAYDDVADLYIVYYYVRANGEDYYGNAEIEASHMAAYYGENYQSHKEYEAITLNNTHYTGITVSQAIAAINAHEVGWMSEIPYIIEGEIEQLGSTPEHMVQYGNCRLDLSDGENSIYAYNTKWLNNQAFQTGNEIAVGGVAAIIGRISYYNASTKEIDSGFFYQYAAPGSTREYGLMTDAESVDFTAAFDTYSCTISPLGSTGNYYAAVEAEQDTAQIMLILFLPSETDTLTAGTYSFAEDLSPNTAYKGFGLDSEGYTVGSYAGYINDKGYLKLPVWYPRNGTVFVNLDGAITVFATNSYGRMIQYRLNNNRDEAIETAPVGTETRKILRNGQVFILRNGTTYTVQGVRVND